MSKTKNAKIWEVRPGAGRKELFSNPENLLKAAIEYFNWCHDNPIYESVLVKYSSSYEIAEVPKTRAFTIAGLCQHLDCNKGYFDDFVKSDAYKNNTKYSVVIDWIKEIIFRQKYEGAAANIFNYRIVAKDLDLLKKDEEASKVEVVVRYE